MVTQWPITIVISDAERSIVQIESNLFDIRLSYIKDNEVSSKTGKEFRVLKD